MLNIIAASAANECSGWALLIDETCRGTQLFGNLVYRKFVAIFRRCHSFIIIFITPGRRLEGQETVNIARVFLAKDCSRFTQ